MVRPLPLLDLDPALVRSHFADPTDRFINRELSWLAFNTRVMEEAQNPHLPLLERVKFLSISAGNLDEFYMVRVAGLKDQARHHVDVLSIDGLTPKEQLTLIEKDAGALMERQQQAWLTLRREMKGAGIHLLSARDLSERDKARLRVLFAETIFPLLTPIAVDPAHPFPFIPNLGIAQVFELQPLRKKKPMIGMVLLPSAAPRFVTLEHVGRKLRLVAVEDVIRLCVEQLFPGFTCKDHAVFTIIRDSDLEIEDEAEDLMRVFEQALKERRRGRVVRVKASEGTSEHLLQFMLEHLSAKPRDVVWASGMVRMSHLQELYDIDRPDLKFEPFTARMPERLNDYGGDCFAAIGAKDIVIHHPYESFDVVVQFLRQAATDPQVVSIKQTLYRTSADSPIVKALIAAAEAGKSVTALVELKARFDEEANIRFARAMERAGVQVVYGFVKYKTHAKISLVVRREQGTLKSYAHFGTGNYHPATAKVYTDLSFFTADAGLCRDAALLFNYMTGYGKPKAFEKVIVAPHNMKRTLLKLIAQEAEHAGAGRPAAIWVKLNALIDPDVIDALYAASQQGVQIELVVRGICGLRPGIKGFSENIHVKSIVGRYLEHARIYCFGAGHGLPSPKAKIFIGSADWMVRNFDYRIEIGVPVENPTVHAQILEQIMVANLKDERQSWILQGDGAYHRLTVSPEKYPHAFAAHDYFMHNPSLSGRGKALAQMGKGTEPVATPRRKPVRRKR